MSDELPETADSAIRAYLFAIGFTLVLIGGELMAEKDGTCLGIGATLVAIALPVHLTWVFWTRLKPRLAGTGLLPQASAITTRSMVAWRSANNARGVGVCPSGSNTAMAFVATSDTFNDSNIASSSVQRQGRHPTGNWATKY